jgi:hypothetical protein
MMIITSQKMIIITVTAVETSNLAKFKLINIVQKVHHTTSIIHKIIMNFHILESFLI